jgi:malate synthase
MQQRITYPKINGVDILFTESFVEYLLHMHDLFFNRVNQVRKDRKSLLNKVHKTGLSSLHSPITNINTDNWTVDKVPDELRNPGIEICGPASVASMMINALNPGPEGERAIGYLDDDEDSANHSFTDTINAALNRLAAVTKTLKYTDVSRNRFYQLQPGKLPFFMHRERGLHLDEHDVFIDGNKISATILGTALTIFHCGSAQANNGENIYFYLPKLESVKEVTIYKDFFDESRIFLKLSNTYIIKAIILVESLPAIYQMEDMLHALGEYGAGLNAARWDLKASILEFILPDSKFIWPDRFDVDIKTTEFLTNIFKRLVAICLKREAVPIGGMATALPSTDQETNEIAANSIKQDKNWEAKQGFLRGWSAHIYHMKVASDQFIDWKSLGKDPEQEMYIPNNYPINIVTPTGDITTEGTRKNIRTIIEYLEGWLNGKGAKGINSMEGKEGKYPALMEDLATARISVGQVAQRVMHSAKGIDDNQKHDLNLIIKIADKELSDILKKRIESDPEKKIKISSDYKKARNITIQWIKNYTNLNFRSLGSYSKKELDELSKSVI